MGLLRRGEEGRGEEMMGMRGRRCGDAGTNGCIGIVMSFC